MYGYMDTDNITRIEKSNVIELDEIAKHEYQSLNPKERKFAELILQGYKDHDAVINAGYSLNNLYNIVSLNRKKTSLCLYISAKQELVKREKMAEEQSNVDMIGDSLKYLHRVLMYDPEKNQDFKPDDNKITAAREILKVLKPPQETGKSRAYGIKKPEIMRNNTSEREKRSFNEKKLNSQALREDKEFDDD